MILQFQAASRRETETDLQDNPLPDAVGCTSGKCRSRFFPLEFDVGRQKCTKRQPTILPNSVDLLVTIQSLSNVKFR
jgi:hypothetical protein